MAAQREAVANRETELQREDQSSFWAIVSVELMPHQQIPAALIALYDISQRKALENELEEKTACSMKWPSPIR
jgi:PAS domain S-box-containing protein